MFVAMNKFKIVLGKEEEFIGIWRNRDTYLQAVPGFVQFHLVKGDVSDDFALFATHSIWDSRAAFENWTKSEAFRKAHANAGEIKGIYLGPPQFEGFESVL